uniref:Peptidase S1 domain-containing protein n=1 Tax=Anopheles culicifacies TaxID=139723 RepID=A0A182MKM9_9DIPT
MTPWLLPVVVTIVAFSDGALAIGNSKPRATGRIVGGNDVNISDFPYQLSLQNNNYHICGASVVANRLALTAAHCCIGSSVSDLTIRGGSTSHEDGGEVFFVSRVFIHPDYDDANLNFDVCIVRVIGSFMGKPNIAIIQPTNSGVIPTGVQGIVSGWGAVYTNGDAVRNLRATRVKIFNTNECIDKTRDYVFITASMFCAGNVGSSICVGDSGGPLVYQKRQIGIVSFIINECGGSTPAIYTRLSLKSVRDFITQTINNDQQRQSLATG